MSGFRAATVPAVIWAFWLVTGNGSPEGFLASFLGALVVFVSHRLYRRVGASDGLATVLTLVLALTTLLWPCARREPRAVLDTLLFTGFLDALLAITASRMRPVVAGLWAGLLLFHDLRFAPAVACGAVHLTLAVPRGHRLAFVAELLAPAALLGAFGELPELARYRGNVVDGLWGLLLSTGKGLLLFSPPMLLGAIALPAAARVDRVAVRAVLLVAVPTVLLQARDLYWSGGTGTWGLPALLYVHPAVLVPLALTAGAADLWRRIGMGVVLALGLFVQVVATLFPPMVWAAVTRDVGTAWLGVSNRAGSDPAACIECFEDTYRLDWLPPFQPVTGHLWLARHYIQGHSYDRAERSAPWRRYVVFHFGAADAYDTTRADWWAGQGGASVVVLIAVELGLIAGGIVVFWRGESWRRESP